MLKYVYTGVEDVRTRVVCMYWVGGVCTGVEDVCTGVECMYRDRRIY